MMRLREMLIPVCVVQFVLTFPSPAAVGSNLIGIHNDTGDLYEISLKDAAAIQIGTTGIPGFGSLELGPDGLLYGFTTDVGASLYTINPADFGTAEVGPLGAGLFFFEGSLAFAPDGVPYGTNLGEDQNPQLFSLDLLTAQAAVIGTMDGVHDINALAWREDGMLVGLDRVSNALIAIDPSNASTTPIAPVDPLVGAIGGMVALDDVGYFTTSGPEGPAPGSNELYSFDLFTGHHTLVGSLSPAIGGLGISGLTVPEPASLLLMLSGAFAVLRRRRHLLGTGIVRLNRKDRCGRQPRRTGI